jgi:hypothetical protein
MSILPNIVFLAFPHIIINSTLWPETLYRQNLEQKHLSLSYYNINADWHTFFLEATAFPFLAQLSLHKLS